MPWFRAASASSAMVMPVSAGSVMACSSPLPEVEPPQELGVEGDDDRGQAHQDGADGRGQGDTGPGQGAGGDRHGEQVVAGRPPEILQHLAVAGLRQPQDPEDAAGVVGGQHDPGRLDGHVGAGADGHAHVGPGQGGGVVDAVADHGHPQAAALEAGHGRVLVLGQDLGEHLVDPRSAATASATWWASPVSMTTRLPSRCSCSTAWRDSGRTVSSSATAPSTLSSRTTYKTVAPRCFHAPTCSASPSGSVSSSWRSRAGPPTASVAPSTRAWTPRPVMERNSPAVGRSPPARSWAWATIARASGCSLSASTAAASRNSPSSSPSTATTPLTCGLPVVRVPVLSNRTASTVRIRSRARRSLTRTPLRAASPVEMAITSGMANPRAWGQAITSTVTVRSTAWSGAPSTSQTAIVMRPAPTAK